MTVECLKRHPIRPESVPLPSQPLPPSTGEISDGLGFSIVGIGASAGGLDACRKFAGALPAGNGMAFILVQHLDPTYESMMVDLLTGYTPMTVVQAADGMLVERDHFYVIPPGTYLSVARRARCVFRTRWRGTERACLSTSCCIRWRRNAANWPSA